MSDTSDHLDPKESTEAKLCAYLEGELAPNERAEIEQHLAANPQHRKLLADLAQTREWMRAIPRENAPTDLAEAFQGQVERSMLLDDAADIGSGMSMTRWPQYAMIAAILVLTLGLGVTLVVMLKEPAGTPVVIMSPMPTATKPSALASQTQEDKVQSMVASPTPAPVVVPTALPPVVVAAVPTAAAREEMPRPLAIAGLHADIVDTSVDQIKTQLASSGYRVPTETKTVCFVVRSDAPTTTMDQVHGFFIRHQLMLEEPARFAATGGQNAFDKSASVNNANANNAQTNEANSQSVPNQTQGGQNANDNPTAGGLIVPPGATQPSNATLGSTTDNSKNTSPAASKTADLPAAETLYVAHGLTPLQLELLNASLATDNPNQSVKRLMLSEGSIIAKSPAPLPGTIAKGQLLTITIPQLIGPGIEKTNVVKVADDGSITLPMVDPIPAIGATTGELEQRITTKYREANLIPDATVTVTVAPTTQPATMPATMPVIATADTTQSTVVKTAATQPAPDAGIDVVVVIQKTGDH